MTDDVQNDSEGTFQWLLKHWKDDFLGKWYMYKHTHKSVKMCSLSSADPAIISLYTKLGNLILAFYKVWLFFLSVSGSTVFIQREWQVKTDGGKFRQVRCVIVVFFSTVLSAAEWKGANLPQRPDSIFSLPITKYSSRWNVDEKKITVRQKKRTFGSKPEWMTLGTGYV